MFGLEIIDILVIIFYFACLIFIGIWSMKRINTQEDYFLAGRRFGKFIQTFAAFGQATSADTCVGVTTTTYTNGAAGIWSSLLYLFATPLYWLVMPWMRRLRLLTLGDFFEERYQSKAIAAVYALIGSIGMMAIISVGFSAMTKTIVALAPKPVEQLSVAEAQEYQRALELDTLKSRDISQLTPDEKTRLTLLSRQNPRKMFSYIHKDILIWIVCTIVIIYAVAGGLEAAFITDTIQGIFIILLSIIMLPFAIGKINTLYGGSGFTDALATMHSRLPESYFEIFGSPTTMDFTWYYILALSVMATINVLVQPNALVAVASAKGEYESRFGFVTGNFMKRIVTIFWGFFALLAIVLYHEKVHDPDMVWGYATLDLLGDLKIGLVGLMIACLMAALMSTADALMITCSSLLTRNVYHPLFPHNSESHYILMGRIIGALVVIGGALTALQFDTILQILKFMWELNVMVAASFWLGMKWRRANRIGAWTSILATSILFFLLPLFIPALFPSLRHNAFLLQKTKSIPITRSYNATAWDVQNRESRIREWEEMNRLGKAVGPRPEKLMEGRQFDRYFHVVSKSIFWTKGVKTDDAGREYGAGMLNIELVALQSLGFHLADNPYAANETLRIVIRTVFPFLILIVVSLFTRPDAPEALDLFYAKMKTPVKVDREKDHQEMELSCQNPHRFDHIKLFPKSNWEFYRWTRVDYAGFFVSVFVVLAIILLLIVLINLGTQ